MTSSAARLAKNLAAWAFVVLAAVGVLRAVDFIGASLAEPVQGRTFATVPELERAVRERLTLPAYFPQSLRWPPTRLAVVGRRPRAVVLSFEGTAGDGERLVLAQTVGGKGVIDPEVLPPATLVESRAIDLDRVGRALLNRLTGQDGARWNELEWECEDRSLRVRSKGSVEELLKMAHSCHREGP